MPIDENGFFIFLATLAMFSIDGNLYLSIGLDILYRNSVEVAVTLVILWGFL